MAEKILIVDDDLDTLRLVGVMLQKQGYQIAAASNGEQALKMAKSEAPALILLDLMMPDIDGVEVAKQLRSDPETRNIYIIMFTAKNQLDDKLQGYASGADDYVTKPVQPPELIAHVKAVLNRGPRGGLLEVEQTRSPNSQLIGIIAAKGGLGVSTIATNLGIALRRRNIDVLVADFRPGCGTIGLDLGADSATGLQKLLQAPAVTIHSQAVSEEIFYHPSGVKFLLSSANPRDARFANAAANFEALTKALTHLAAVTILDLGPSLTQTNQKILPLCSRVVLVVEPIPHTLTQSRALIAQLAEMGISENRIETALVNRVRSGIQLSFAEVQSFLGRDLSVIFTPAPELAFQAISQQSPMVILQPDGLSAEQFNALAERILRPRR